jgi:hypothetical protein
VIARDSDAFRKPRSIAPASKVAACEPLAQRVVGARPHPYAQVDPNTTATAADSAADAGDDWRRRRGRRRSAGTTG